ncbi:unnamed protein product [Rodentolepis nana]|uniref:C2H2-type domain-containing protein n=1 Tax=Rodentolepis nana TaxID=102285 RepID=A0A0R3TDY7_RODNA|nr:unnamed protein product [Rodentolepis nana]
MSLRQEDPVRPFCCTFCASLGPNQRFEKPNYKSIGEKNFRTPGETPSSKVHSSVPNCSRIKFNGCSFEVCGQEESTYVKFYTPTSDISNVYLKPPRSSVNSGDPKRNLDTHEYQETNENRNRVPRYNQLPTISCVPDNDEGTGIYRCSICCRCTSRSHPTNQNTYSGRSRNLSREYENMESSITPRPSSLRNTLHCDVELDLPIPSGQHYSQDHTERKPSEIVILHSDSNEEEPTKRKAGVSNMIPPLTVPDNSSMYLIKQDGSILDLASMDNGENGKKVLNDVSDSVGVTRRNSLNSIKIPRNCSLFLIQANQPGSSNDSLNAEYCLEIETIPTTISHKTAPIFLTTSSYEEELKTLDYSPAKIHSPGSSTTAIKSDSKCVSIPEEYTTFDTNNDIDSRILTCQEVGTSKGNFINMDENDICNTNLKGNIQEKAMGRYIYHSPDEAKIISQDQQLCTGPDAIGSEEIEDDMVDLGGISAVQEPDGSVRLLITRSNGIEIDEEGNSIALQDSTDPDCMDSIRFSPFDTCQLPPELSAPSDNPRMCLKGALQLVDSDWYLIVVQEKVYKIQTELKEK